MTELDELARRSDNRAQQLQLLATLATIAKGLLPAIEVFGVVYFPEDGPDGHFVVPVMKHINQNNLWEPTGPELPTPGEDAHTSGLYLTLGVPIDNVLVTFVELRDLGPSTEWCGPAMVERLTEGCKLLVDHLTGSAGIEAGIVSEKLLLYRRSDYGDPWAEPYWILPRPGEVALVPGGWFNDVVAIAPVDQELP